MFTTLIVRVTLIREKVLCNKVVQFNPIVSYLTLYTLTSKFNSHLLSLCVFNRRSGENLLKYQLDSSSVIMSSILMTTLFYKALILQGEICCWSLLGLKGLTSIGLIFIRLNKKAIVKRILVAAKKWRRCENGTLWNT